MTVKALIAMLRKMPQEAEARVFDADAEEWMPVSGATYGGPNVDLYSDSDEDESAEDDALQAGVPR
jgi:hypothetical protein